MREWSETEKAFWILEHGEPKIAWIFERNGDDVYRRPFASPDTELPPWVSNQRELVSSGNKITGKTFNIAIMDEAHELWKL